MPKRRHLVACAVVLLYAWTWVGGWVLHARQLREDAAATYRAAERFRREGLKVELNQGGPIAGVAWCLPVLPGVLLAWSAYSAGPLLGRGGLKVVLYYGLGSAELCTLVGWVS
jgi:hypothetical protein